MSGMGMFAVHGVLMLVMMAFSFIVFAVVLGIIIFTLVRGVKRERRNDRSPRLSVPATMVAKRTDVSSHMHSHSHHYGAGRTYTTYYATFQVESGDRMEFQLTGEEYGWLVEGDRGTLHFQGTRFLGFDRN